MNGRIERNKLPLKTMGASKACVANACASERARERESERERFVFMFYIGDA